MYYSKMFIPTVKEVPKDATIPSHILMIRAGMIKKVASGIYGFLPLGYRVIKKLENIIREEMDRIGGNEFFLPILVPGELWKTSHRWYSMGPELYRLKDRNMQDYVLAPTHEEVFTSLLKDHIKSYKDLPLTVYHIGFKFRDEIRPRFGVMRGRSFIMKDAYSFHRASDNDSLDRVYNDMASAYRKVFKRCGLETIPVSADPGAMGGSQSEEFMVPSQVGEEYVVKCSACDYIANREKATCKYENFSYSDTGEPSLIETRDIKTIAELVKYLKISPRNLIKTLVYKTLEGNFVIALIRGDLEINLTKLKNLLGVAEVEPAANEEALEKLGIPLGFAGPIGVKSVPIHADYSVEGIKGGVTGANRVDYHFKNVNTERDFNLNGFTDLRLVNEGDGCPSCGSRLIMFKGIELGHIFKLGDKYTRAFSVSYLDEDGNEKTPLMGCYGIGLERTMACVIEQNHDENGIIWPITIAPFHVYILPIKYVGEMERVSKKLYQEFKNAGIETFLDDRDLRPGVKFKDADLVGIPFRITVGDKGLSEGTVELMERKTGKKENIQVEQVTGYLKKRIENEMKKFA